MTTQYKIPETITAGDTAEWTRQLSDYPASAGWSLAYRLINSAATIDISSSASGDDHAVSVSAATSAAYAAGEYRWQEFVTKGAERHTIATGAITIAADWAAASAGIDIRSDAEKTLAAVNAWLTTKDPGVSEYEIAGRRIKYIPIGDLLKIRSSLQREVREEKAALLVGQGIAPANRLRVRF